MASDQAWEIGARIGSERAQERRARKQALSDTELYGKINDLIQKRTALVTKIPALKGTDDYQPAIDALTEIDKELRTTYHPDNNPKAIEKFGHLLTDHLKITKPEDRVKEEAAKREQGIAGDERQARQEVAAGPLSPEQQAGAAGRVNLTSIQSSIKNFDTINPKASPEERQTYINSLLQSPSKANNKPDVLPLTLSDSTTISAQWEPIGKKWQYLNGEDIPPSLLAGAKITPKPVAKKGRKYDSSTGEVVDLDTQDRYSIGDIGKPDTPPWVAQMFNDAKSAMDDKQKKALELATQRGAAYGAGKFGNFVDPANPTQVIAVPYGEAAKRGLHLATGAQYLTMEAMLKASTSGPIANEVVAFSTALQHADLLAQAAVALNNRDNRAWNKVKNELSTQFGDEAPTNFQTIAGAYTREVTKALAAGHVTDTEISLNGATIPQEASDEQILGAVNAYKNLMKSKINIRMQQIQAGMSGVPFTGVGNATPNGVNPPAGGEANKHKIKIGNKYYVYNGTGATDDLNNYTEVKP